ncbi:hypothetical protein CPC08DRAFT_753698 [Agrocybe pediades]|nr:hypothetical protein CPC08DRAFT_753698 [Agrocybe pediades]
MSTPDDFPYSVSQQKAFINAAVNSTLLLQLLFGVYTGLFPVTIYIYIQKENRSRARDMIIIGNTVLLYGTTALNVLSNWVYINAVYCTQGETRVDIFTANLGGVMLVGDQVILDITTFVVFLFADSLLVWRCFHSYGRSLWKSFLPIVLLIVETVLVISISVYSCLMDVAPNFATSQTGYIADRLSAAAYLSAAVTSLVSTGMICAQIWRHTALNPRSRKNYRTIISALVESSAFYTVIVLLSALLNFIGPLDEEISFTVLLLTTYIGATTHIISGLAPALMIARLHVSSSQEDSKFSSAHLPFDLIGCATPATGTNITNVEAGLKMQPTEFTLSGKEEGKEIQVVPRIHEHEDDGEKDMRPLNA